LAKVTKCGSKSVPEEEVIRLDGKSCLETIHSLVKISRQVEQDPKATLDPML
jgi:hypothetical protein